MQLTANVFVETGYHGANVGYITTTEGVVMVETPYSPTEALAWRKEIASKGPLRYLIQTEPHDDHVATGSFFNVPVIAHEKARDAMLAADLERIKETIEGIDPVGLARIDNYRLNIPVITFSERLSLYLGRHNIYLIHLPGHTASQIAVYIPEERVVFTGDNVTYQVQGFLHEANPFAWLRSLKKIGKLDVDYIIPGHGEVCDKSYLKEEEDYILGSLDTVRQAIERGWSRDEAVSRVTLTSPYPLDEGAQSIGGRLLQMSVANLYDQLSHR